MEQKEEEVKQREMEVDVARSEAATKVLVLVKSNRCRINNNIFNRRAFTNSLNTRRLPGWMPR